MIKHIFIIMRCNKLYYFDLAMIAWFVQNFEPLNTTTTLLFLDYNINFCSSRITINTYTCLTYHIRTLFVSFLLHFFD